MQNLLKELEAILKKESKFVSEDGQLLKNSIIEAGLHLDTSLLKLLMKNKIVEKRFFIKVGNALVFDKIKFQKFVSNKQFLADSYTSFKNKIELSDGHDGYLKESNNIVLNWAYKDCVLEGGMTKAEKGKDEIFYNTTLAPDEITRLYAPKVFTGFGKWDTEAVKKGKAKKVTEIKATDNLLIKGNNLLALHCLKLRYEGKVKMIYIDPPFNTGSDSFKYNDRFSHSTWLTFMRNRLEVSKKLLTDEGTILVHCDDNEQAYLKVLMDEIFGRDSFVTTIPRLTSSQRSGQEAFMNVSHDYILCYSYSRDFNHFIKRDIGDRPIRSDKNGMYIEGDTKAILAARSQGYSKGGDYDFKYNGKIYKPVDRHGVRNRWLWTKQRMQAAADLGILVETRNTLRMQLYLNKKFNEKTNKLIDRNTDLIFHTADFMNKEEYTNPSGAREIEKILGKNVFDNPKPEKLLRDLIQMTTEKKDIVLDFFSGSGTTLAASHKSERQWIGVEQMNYVKELPESRLKEVIKGEQNGVSGEVNWKGGGEFIYCELKEWNENYIQEIRKAKTKAAIKNIYKKIKKESFYRYDVDISAYDGRDFNELSLRNQKKALCNCLDINHLYVNYNERDDSRYDVTDEEKELTKKLYRK